MEIARWTKDVFSNPEIYVFFNQIDRDECNQLLRRPRHERTAHPLLLHWLQDPDHDWRRLRLVNRAMAAAFRLYAPEVAAHTVRHEQLRQACAAMSTELAALYPPRDVWAPRRLHDPLPRLIAEFERMPFPHALHTSG
jgi:hypothetical protein